MNTKRYLSLRWRSQAQTGIYVLWVMGLLLAAGWLVFGLAVGLAAVAGGVLLAPLAAQAAGKKTAIRTKVTLEVMAT